MEGVGGVDMSDRWEARVARPMSTGLNEFCVDDEIARLKGEPSWTSGRRIAITLTKGPLRVTVGWPHHRRARGTPPAAARE